ncbi:glycerol acyltransferase [Actibacterium sp. EMB200-NS6]|nr:glycerol acyltransferase [Actibacterium sp. EMB200-NS6]
MTRLMRERIDPLIEERAPWLFAQHPWSAPSRDVLTRLLGYPRTVALGEALQHHPSPVIMDEMARLLALDVEATGLENIPRSGPALVVANHPTGIADGIMLWSLLAPIRPDLFFYANCDILRVLPQMETIIAPVEWREEKRSHGKTRETMAYTRKAIDEGRVGVIFPSGRLAKRRGLKLHERPWMASAAMIARKFDLPVIPINIRARNSVLFYLFDLIHPTLRDITLFHETLNKGSQPYRMTVGQPISPGALPVKSDAGIDMLRQATLALGGRHAPTVSLVDSTRRPSWARTVLSG